MTTAQAIVKLREKMGLTQNQFAKALKVTITSVSRYENGREPSSLVLKALADLAHDSDLLYLHDLFVVKRQADIASGIEKLQSSGTARRIPLGELNRWKLMIDSALQDLTKLEEVYRQKMLQAEAQEPSAYTKLTDTNRQKVLPSQLLQMVSREMTPYQNCPNGGSNAKK